MPFTPTDPRAMTEPQRRRAIVAILAAGLGRTPRAGQLPPDLPSETQQDIPAQNPAEASAAGLEVAGDPRLSVTAGEPPESARAR